VLLSTLDALHLGLAPERRREAVRTQTLTRRTSAMPERSLEVVVDEDGWAIFHPADLQTGEDAADTAERGTGLERHFQRGNVIAVKGTPGRRCRVRLTAGDLSDDEMQRKRPETSFRLLVRHGRLFLGGAALLRTGTYQERLEFADAQQWFDIPNGLYRAVVTALERPLEGPEEDTTPEPEDATICEYVVQLHAESTLEDIAAPTSAPEL
jgi:hypothetical protein